VAGGDVRALLDQPETDQKWRVFGGLSLALLAAVEALLESGLVPLTGGASIPGGRSAAPPVPPTKPAPPPGLRELRECMEKAEKENDIFGANLGALPIANRNNLATVFSAGLKESVTACCAESDADMNEAVRDVDDALSCVSDMEFLGAKSKWFLKEGDPMLNKFCTMHL
jgi:hypothetical protein